MKQKDFSMSQREAREWEPDFDINPKIRPERAIKSRIGLGFTPVEAVSDHNVSSFGAVETNINMPAPASKKGIDSIYTPTNGEPTSELQLFDNPEFGQITVVEINNEPYFVAADVCHILELSNVSDRLKNTLEISEYLPYVIHRSGQKRTVNVVSESGLYALIFQSRKPEAKKFRKWITSEVLPSIRKHGAYMTEDTIEKVLNDPDLIIGLATKLKEEKQRNLALQKENKAKQKQIIQMIPLAEHAEELMKSDSCMTTTQIAAELGMSARRLNENLRCSGVQYRCNGQWILYSKYKDMGLTRTRTTEYRGTDGSIKTAHTTVWTEKGRFFIHDRFM